MKQLGSAIWEFLMRIAYRCFSFLARLLRRELTDASWRAWEQFIKFSCVGCLNALITLLVYYIVIFFRPGWYVLGNALGYAAGIINSYWFNSRLVFDKRGVDAKQSFLRMLVCYGTTYFLQLGILYLFIETCHISEIVSPILVILITTPINFLLNKLWAFRRN